MGAEGNFSDMSNGDKALLGVAVVLTVAIGLLWIVGSAYGLLPLPE